MRHGWQERRASDRRDEVQGRRLQLRVAKVRHEFGFLEPHQGVCELDFKGGKEPGCGGRERRERSLGVGGPEAGLQIILKEMSGRRLSAERKVVSVGVGDVAEAATEISSRSAVQRESRARRVSRAKS